MIDALQRLVFAWFRVDLDRGRGGKRVCEGRIHYSLAKWRHVHPFALIHHSSFAGIAGGNWGGSWKLVRREMRRKEPMEMMWRLLF